jgi:hypothetical protein
MLLHIKMGVIMPDYFPGYNPPGNATHTLSASHRAIADMSRASMLVPVTSAARKDHGEEAIFSSPH